MRIAHVTATFPPYHGGTGNVCFQNARGLVQRGHSVHVFTSALSGAPSHEVREGVIIQRLQPLMRIGNAPLLPGLTRVLSGFDLIHLHYPFFGGEMTALIAGLSHTPLVITYHQDVLLAGLMGVVEKIMRQTIGRMTLRSAQRLLFTSLDYGHASYVYAMLRDREHIIDELPNGVDTKQFNMARSPVELRTSHHLTQDDRIVLLVASLDTAHYFKGVDVFLQSLALVSPNIKAVIVGDGDLRPTYEQLAERLGIRSRVSFAGRVSDEELPLFYRMADVTALPSTTMGEAFGLVLVESMASGTPVIATNLPGVRTVVDHGNDGFLVTPGDPGSLASALDKMLSDDPLRRTMGSRGRAKTEQRYDWVQIAARLETIYNQVLNESLTRRSVSIHSEQ